MIPSSTHRIIINKLINLGFVIFLTYIIAGLIGSLVMYFINLNIWIRWILFSFIFILIFWLTSSSLELKISIFDYFIGLILISPLYFFLFWSSLPLGDDIRYIGAALLKPNGFFSLSGILVIEISKMFNINILSSYWFNLIISLYVFTLIIIILLKTLNLKHVYISAFILIYIPNLTSLLFLFMLIHDFRNVNGTMIYTFEYSILPRIITINPNLLKNISDLLVLSAVLVKNLKELRNLFYVALVFTLGLLVHIQEGLYMIFVVIVLIIILFNKVLNVIDYIKFISLSLLMIFLLYLLFGRQILYPLAVFSLSIPIIFVFLIIYLLGIYILVFILKKITKKFYILFTAIFIIFITLFPFRIYFNPYCLDLRSLLLFHFYVFPIYLMYSKNDNFIYKLLFIPTLLSVVVVLFSFLFYNYMVSVGQPLGLVGRYTEVLSRSFVVPAFIFISFLPVVLFIDKSEKVKYFFLIISFLVFVFWTLYWGYYYRNPWADVGPCMTATCMNYVLSSFSSKAINELTVTPWVHALVDAPFVSDILLGLKLGTPYYTPVTIMDDSIPFYYKNTAIYLPSILIAGDQYVNFSKYFNPIYIYDLNGYKIYVYIISNYSKNLKIMGIRTPVLPTPYLGSDFYIELLKIQNRYNNVKIILVLDNKTYGNLTKIGSVELAGKVRLNSTTVNLTSILAQGYRYLIYIPNFGFLVSYKCLINGKIYELPLYQFYYYGEHRYPFLLSIESLISYSNGCTLVNFTDVKTLYAVKGYRIHILNESH
ncbi:hypothetical protein [Pyrobaculum neutrophilum]|nr:hypothetical protein [Pyrobaculum neutrophilum]